MSSAVTLHPWPVRAARALLAGRPVPARTSARWHQEYPMPDTVDGLAMVLDAHIAMGVPAQTDGAWWTQEIVVDGQVVGDLGFHGPPPLSGPVEVEIGYCVVPSLRRRGIATQAGALLLVRAWRHGADTVLAETEPDNLASRRVLERLGFRLRPDGFYALERPT